MFIAIYSQIHIIPRVNQVATILKVILLTSHLSFLFIWQIILIFPLWGHMWFESPILQVHFKFGML